MYSLVRIIKVHLVAIAFINLFVLGCCELEEISYCSEPQSSALLVSTLDGSFTKLTDRGDLKWTIKTGPDALLNSNIHNLELTNNGRWVRFIPSLNGMLYKFDGTTVDPISVTAETLIKSSERYTQDIVAAGSIEVKTYGIGFRSGNIFYECSSIKCVNITKNAEAEDDVLVLKRTSQTVRAVEIRSGIEKWNFSVGDVDVYLPRISCIDVNAKKIKWNITTTLPDGLLEVNHTLNNERIHWQHRFSSPIVKIWKWSGKHLEEFDTFKPNTPSFYSSLNPALYIGMHNKQLYIQESKNKMLKLLDTKDQPDTELVESRSLSKIPWKPVPASSLTERDEAVTTSVLYSSLYVNEADIIKKNTEVCPKKNVTIVNVTIENVVNEVNEKVETVEYIKLPMWVWWKEIAIISISTTFFFHYARKMTLNYLRKKGFSKSSSLECPNTEETSRERSISECSASFPFNSRYLNDFDTLQCLGKGGFGVVFQVRQKLEEWQYAVKRIRLPNEMSRRDRVLREVKALAKMEHQHIVRYFAAWVEHPPIGWTESFDSNFMSDNEMTSTYRRTQSVSIMIDKVEEEEEAPVSVDNSSYPASVDDLSVSKPAGNSLDPICADSSDDFIVFENSNKQDSKELSATTLPSINSRELSATTLPSINSKELFLPSINSESQTTHSKRKRMWKRLCKKSFSLDIKPKPNLDPPIFLYIQMQLCQKESLKDWLFKNETRDKVVVYDFFSQILSAVEYVHLKGCIHRDLKPGNIFFSMNGQIKVGDFGLVKDMEDSLELQACNYNSGYGTLSRDVGTRLYMSPEQLNNKVYDYKVDIYSLGLIFFELLTPFKTGMERFKCLTALRSRIYPKDFAEDFPFEHDLLESMLCDDPKERLTTIGIRAKPPFRDINASYDEKYFYELPKPE
ncbi:eukaryotic translation initiation factor 2-alpha kinase-like isoform X2 [Harmonia axyridis]|uniref:eukaryotic translation initiation factor 2-alpha kinase-like isoform X2 n=1 Tax=Harmonia axyridis TaxID=115357 RepID=UPI001E277C7D|nr:eukaryotic translation initiation factor 2-alpha kinase-like isoform X2 [Harmonia axyridis]